MKPNTDIRQLFNTLTPIQRDEFLADVVRMAAQQQQRQRAVDYSTPAGAVDFVRKVLRQHPTPYQQRALEALATNKRLAVRSLHGAGKTAFASWVVLWFLGAFALEGDVKIVTTAPTHRQLNNILWREIGKSYRAVDWNHWIGERPELLRAMLRTDNALAFAAASDDPLKLEGVHGDHVLVLIDEAKGVPAEFWYSLEGALSTGNAYALAISTPGAPAGVFYDIHTRKPGYEDWTVQHWTLKEAISAGRVSEKWAEQRGLQFGTESAAYQNRVLGEFADSGEDSVIPLSWVEAANERWRALAGKYEGAPVYAVDPARSGVDKTALAERRGNAIVTVKPYSDADLMKVTGRVITALADKRAPIYVDVVGLGAGVYDRLKEQGYRAIAINAASAPPRSKDGSTEYANMRAWLWFNLREALDPANPNALALPPIDTLTGDLTAPRYTVNSRGAVLIESKDDLRKRLKRSTDYADAVAMAAAADTIGKQRKARVRAENPFFSGSKRDITPGGEPIILRRTIALYTDEQ